MSTFRSIAFGLIIALLSGWSVTAQSETPTPPIIDISNVARLVPVFQFDMESSTIAWVEGEPITATGTPTPERSSLETDISPVLQINTDGTRAAIVTTLPDVLWLVDLRSRVWRPFLLPDQSGRSQKQYPMTIRISPDFSWLAISGQWTANDEDSLRFWSLSDLFAQGGTAITTTPPPPCLAQVTVSSTSLRAEPATNSSPLSYPLRGETFPVRALTTDRGWLQVTTAGQRGWLNTDFVALGASCSAVPVLLTPETATARTAFSTNGRAAQFTTDSRYFVLEGSFSSNGFQLVDPASGRAVYDHSASPVPETPPSPDITTGLILLGREIVDLNTLQTVSTLQAQDAYESAPKAAMFSPDHTRLFAGWGALGRLYDVATGKVLKQVALISDIYGFRWSPDGRYLLISLLETNHSANFTTFLWDTTDPSTDIALTDSDAVTPLPASVTTDQPFQFTPDSQRIILAETAHVWNIPTHRLLDESNLSSEPKYCSFVLPRQDGMLCPDDAGLAILALDGRRQGLLPVMTSSPNQVELMGSGRWLTVTETHPPGHDGITLWAALGQDHAITLRPTPTPTPTELRYNRVYDLTQTPFPLTVTPTPLPTLTPRPSPTPYLATLFLPTLPPSQALTETDVLSADNAGAIRLLDVLEPPISLSNQRGYVRFNLGFAENGNLYMTADDHSLVIWSVNTGAAIRNYSLAPDSPLAEIAVTADAARAAFVTQTGEFVLVSLAADGTFSDLFRERIGTTFSARNSLAFSSDGSKLALVQPATPEDRDREFATVRDGGTGIIQYRVRVSGHYVQGVAFTPANQLVALDDSGLSIYQDEGAPIFKYQARTDYRQNLRGPFFVSPSFRHGVQVLDQLNLALTQIDSPVPAPMDGPAPAQLLQGHTCALSSYDANVVLFSEDDTLLMSTDTCATVRFWDANSGNNLTPLEAVSHLPRGITLINGWSFITASGEIVRWQPSFITNDPDLDSVNRLSDARLSPDGRTLALIGAQRIALFGIPSEARSALRSVLGQILPETVNVRATPTLGSAILTTVTRGSVVVAGRDPTGRFVYLPAYLGWVNAGTQYVQILGASVEDLPIRH